MSLKYYFEFTDLKRVVHRCEIHQEGFAGDATLIYGNLSTDKTGVKDSLDSIRGTGLKINIEANSDLTFSDLYTEEERTFSAKYFIDGQLEFLGWLSPEGLYQDFVRNNWEISLYCTDGLGFLNNLSYIENTGLDYIGKQSALEIISNCLKRTNLQQNILTSVNVRYNGLSLSVDPLVNTYFNSDRFIKDDGKTVMNCKEVLTSILECFSACITQYKGSWVIYCPNHTYNVIATQAFFRYDYEGTALSPATEVINFNQVLGSQINNRYPHHYGENQQISTESSLGAYRINYKYGLVKRFTSNNNFVSYSDTNIPDYTIVDSSYLSFPSDRLGILVDTNTTSVEVLRYNDTISLSEGDRVKLFLRTIANAATDPGRYYGAVFEIKLVGATTYYLKIKELLSGGFTPSRVYSASWETTYNTIKTGSFVSGSGGLKEEKNTYESEDLPIDGDVEIRIFTSIISSGAPGGTPQGEMYINELSFSPIVNDGNVKGENHTFQRTTNPSTKIKDIKTVYNGDNESDIYEGAIYKADQTTPTSLWSRDGFGETKPLLRIMGENKMRMNSRPLKVFKGTTFGYIPYLSVVRIDNIDGLFMPIEYEYRPNENTTELTLKEILNLELTDVSYEFTEDFGDVVEPTIRG